jgi:hypothetical protein
MLPLSIFTQKAPIGEIKNNTVLIREFLKNNTTFKGFLLLKVVYLLGNTEGVILVSN